MASFILPTLLALSTTLQASPLLGKRSTYPNPEPCSGQCSGPVHDPNIVLRSDGTYFRFASSNGTNIATAPAMSGPWTYQGQALPSGSIINIPGNTDLWAPDCFYYDGLYYMYYAVSTAGSQDSDIGVATSSTMDVGSWTDHGSIDIPANSDYNKIDPNPYQPDPNGPIYMSFGSYWDDIYQVTMASPPLKQTGNLQHLEQNTTNPGHSLPPGPSEGSYQFAYNVGGTLYYYLFFSSGQCCGIDPSNPPPPGDEYKVMVCRSNSPTGGFVDQEGNSCLTDNGGTLVLGSHGYVYAPGGQGVFNDPNLDSPVLYYHYINPSVGYTFDDTQFGYNLLDFSSGWPVVTGSSNLTARYTPW